MSDLDDYSLVDYTDTLLSENYFGGGPEVVYAHGKGRHVLILSRCEPMRRFDGKTACYQLEYRELSCQCERPGDEAFVCVEDSEYTYWQAQELKKVVHRGKPIPNVDLFDHFNLF